MDHQFDALGSEPIYLSDENGDQMAFRFLDLIQYQEKEYIVLMPLEGPYQGEAVILHLDRSGGDEGYVDVEDPKTLRAVYEQFKEHFQGQFIFED
jgi:uncharacterized protein YrzB (UPF0473 family)